MPPGDFLGTGIESVFIEELIPAFPAGETQELRLPIDEERLEAGGVLEVFRFDAIRRTCGVYGAGTHQDAVGLRWDI